MIHRPEEKISLYPTMNFDLGQDLDQERVRENAIKRAQKQILKRNMADRNVIVIQKDGKAHAVAKSREQFLEQVDVMIASDEYPVSVRFAKTRDSATCVLHVLFRGGSNAALHFESVSEATEWVGFVVREDWDVFDPHKFLRMDHTGRRGKLNKTFITNLWG